MLLLPPPHCERCDAINSSVQMRARNPNYRRSLLPHEELEIEVLRRLGYYSQPGKVILEPLDMPDEVANRDRSLCDPCAEDEASYWQERWDEYHAGLM